MSYLDINIIARFTLKLTIFILIRCKLGRDIVNIEWDRLWNEEGATQNNVQIKKMSKISNKRGRYNDIQDKRRKNGPKRCRSIESRAKALVRPCGPTGAANAAVAVFRRIFSAAGSAFLSHASLSLDLILVIFFTRVCISQSIIGS